MKYGEENFLDTIGFFDSLIVQFFTCVTLDILFVLDNFFPGIDAIIDIPQAFASPIIIEMLAGEEGSFVRVLQAVGFFIEIVPIPFFDILPIFTISFFYKIWRLNR